MKPSASTAEVSAALAQRATQLLAAAGLGRWRRVDEHRGISHVLWHVDADRHRYMVRLPATQHRTTGAIRMEATVLERVSAAGLAPKILHFDPSDGGMVYRRVPGPTWCAADLQSASKIDALAAVLDRLHAIVLPLPALDLGAAVDGYAKLIIDRWPDDHPVGESLAGLRRELALLAPELRVGRLCHNDLVARNIVGYGVPRIIDWEYAAPFDPRFDLATLTALVPMSDASRGRLFDACGVDAHDRALLPRFERLVRLLAWAWAMAVLSEHHDNRIARRWLDHLAGSKRPTDAR